VLHAALSVAASVPFTHSLIPPRCSLPSFYALARAIENHPVFLSTGQKPQRPAFVQLGVFLHHFGAPNRHHLDTARECHVAAGSVYLYIGRVITAISSLRNQCVSWPTQSNERLQEVKLSFHELGFSDCIGLVDGCLMQLAFIPKEDPMIYYCRKKFYGINVQGVVDHEGYITFYDVGWPANQNDVTVFRRSLLWTRRSDFFGNPGGQNPYYLLADKGYQCTPYTVRPFTDKEVQVRGQRARRRKFNQLHSRTRIGVEHAFGNLKGRFPGLRLIGGRDITRVYLAVKH